MTDIVLVSIIAGGFNLLLWVVQKLWDRRKQSKKTDAEIQNIDANTIATLNKSIKTMTDNHEIALNNYHRAMSELSSVSQVLDTTKNRVDVLETTVEALTLENAQLKDKNKVFESAIFSLQKENFELRQESETQRKLIEFERGESLKLRLGINRLIDQLKGMSVSPVWQPDGNQIEGRMSGL